MAETTLLATKLFIPQVSPGLVFRPRLIERLKGVLNNRLTLVSAPAGFGKTTLLSQWIQESHVPTAWLSLEDAENDPVRFWEYFITALQKIFPEVGKTALPLLHSSSPVSVESILTSVVNEITTSNSNFVLVLDDYHVIDSEAVHVGVGFLIDHLPTKMHLLIATRIDPYLPLSRFRGKGTLLEIRSDDLRFTLEEASSLFAGLGMSLLSPDNIQALNTRAEGWVTGLKMAVLSIRENQDVQAFLSAFTGSQRYIMDYLIEEVLMKQPPEVREFLLKTSILERLSGPLCDAVTQGTNSRETLINLEKANLFVVPLDASREWYRYHHLFADLLQHQLELDFGEKKKDELHRKASEWYEIKGFFDEAINHALSGEDWAKAIELIRNPAVMARELRSLTLLNWLRRIPEEQLRTHEGIYLNYIWALMTDGQLSAAENCLKYLDTIAGNNTTLQGRIAIARANIAVNIGDITKAEEYAVKAHSLLPPDDATRVWTQDRSDHAIIGLILATVLMMQGRHLEAENILQSSLEFLQKIGASSSTIDPLVMLGTIAFLKGELHKAARLGQDAIEAVKGHPKTAAGHLWLGNIYYEWNDLERAISHYEQAAEMLSLQKGPEITGYDIACFKLALTRIAMGDISGATKAMEDADKLLSDGTLVTPRNRALNTSYHAAIALTEGDVESAARWVDDIVKSGAPLPDNIPVSIIRLIYAQRGRAVEEKEFQAAYERFKPQGLRYMMMAARIVQALDSLGPDNPLIYLAEALTLAKTEGYIRVFVDFGLELKPLLKQAITKGIEPEYAQKLLSITEGEDRRRQIAKAKGVPVPQSSEFLSLRELEVLRSAAEGLSNRQIAEKLIVGLGTVKTHIHNITQKLSARNRTGAIARARELKLI